MFANSKSRKCSPLKCAYFDDQLSHCRLKAFTDEESFLRYYNENDLKRVAQILHSSNLYDTVYSGIFKGIMKYWNMSEDAFVHTDKVEKEETTPNHEVIS